MSGRKGTGPPRTKPRGAKYEPYGRPRTSEASGPRRYQKSGLTNVPTGLMRELLGDENEQDPEPSKRSLARISSAEATMSMESEYSVQDSEDIEVDLDPVYDALSHETTKGVPNAGDLELWTRPAAEFIRSGVGTIQHADDWIGTRPLGEGGFGLAGLWERIGEDGFSEDQVVVKQIGCGRSGDWDPAIPQEVIIMHNMNATDCPGVIEIRGYKRYLKESVHRIFMEYCPYGDLRRLYKRYRRYRQYFPEAFLWDVFYYQVEAAAAMVNGPADANWEFEEIVHRDIKPGNVFLANPNPDENLFYPVAKLGDWGLAIATGISDDRNPSRYRGAGTRNYMAPEQRDTRDKGWYLLGPSSRLSSYTNVWAIGATMYDLLTLHHVKKALYRDDEDEDGEGLGEIHTDQDPEYTHTLRHLVRSCLRPNPQDRPDIRQLQETIRSSRSHFKLECSRLRGEDQSVPHESERLYFSGKEIEEMSSGRWQPTNQDMTEGDESGFRDPRYSAIRFPKWGPVKKTNDEDADQDSSSDGGRGTRRIRAGYTVDVAQVAAPTGGGDDEMEAESGSLGGESTSKPLEPREYRLPTRNKWDRLNVAAPTGGGEDEMEAESGSFGEELTSKPPEPREYRLPTRNKIHETG